MSNITNVCSMYKKNVHFFSFTKGSHERSTQQLLKKKLKLFHINKSFEKPACQLWKDHQSYADLLF